MPVNTGELLPRPNLIDRSLRAFSDVRAGESTNVILMLANVFLILVSYYVIKTVREPLILAGGAEVKSYAAAGQALVLVGFVPLYSWLSARVDRGRLIMAVNAFFILCIEAFFLAAKAEVPYVGVVFFIWVGIFNMSIVAQFWSYANDIYTKEAGERLFPLIAIGMTLGSPFGAKIAQKLFEMGARPYDMLHISAVLLVVSLGLYVVVNRRQRGQAAAAANQALSRSGGFGLVLGNTYLLAIGALLVLLNLVNTTGEYILSRSVSEAASQAAGLKAQEAAAAGLGFDRKVFAEGFIGSFYGGYLFATSVTAAILQAFVASRLVKWLGLAGAIFALPLVALGGYGTITFGASLALVKWAKVAENGTDYSIMNTGKQLLWLPTSRDEKYKAKQAIDTFFVRSGDVLAAVLVYVGTHFMLLGARGFATVSLGLIVLWLVLARRVLRLNRALNGAPEPEPAVTGARSRAAAAS